MRTTIAELMDSSGVTFGTSGARGLVSAMTDRVCFAYTDAFLQHLERENRAHPSMQVAVAGDLRSSTPRIIRAITRAIVERGYEPVLCGRIPSPALALFGFKRRIPSIMVTGSHIPDDRNGIKFNAPDGEILKDDETSIRMQHVAVPNCFDTQGMLNTHTELPENDTAAREYVRRYTEAFPDRLLEGKDIGLYAHSAVGKNLLHEILESIGAKVTRIADSDVFIPVDTEAIRPEDVTLALQSAAEQKLDAIVSTDGDGDRPLISDERGRWLRGDIAGVLCAKQLGADVVVTPVTSNTVVEECGYFEQVVRTRIGSPYVIEAMTMLADRLHASSTSSSMTSHGPESLPRSGPIPPTPSSMAESSISTPDPYSVPPATSAYRSHSSLDSHAGRRRDKCVVGYEANGGFLTATPINTPAGRLDPLPTRDAVIVHIAILWAMASSQNTISSLVASLPPRFTWSDRLRNFPTEISHAKLREFDRGGFAMIADAFGSFGYATAVNWTDGMRVTFLDGNVVHIRASGNAPELRCYTESSSDEEARYWNARVMELAETWMNRS